jgi:hypothetical protein
MKLNTTLNRKDSSLVKRFETDHARLIPSVENAQTMYVELDGIRLIFRNGIYEGFYRP